MTSDPGSASSVKILHSKDGSRFLARFDKVQNRVVHEKVVDEDEYMKEAICSNSNLLSIESGISTQKDTLPGPKESITTRREITSSNAVHFIPDGAHLTKEELMQQIKNEQTINILNTRFKKPYAPSLDKKKLSAAKLAFRPVSYFALSFAGTF
ncbi:unnamed protein product [Protopolystoma xenopodis]|uniref:Uncharacterized protein n=1 Tax=Protopolystoma xenopodis TaxID=117903 RepID=A0A3S5AK42_9PLAT|nr:unnamed protein product [Protopolystoma xenopodis]